MDLASKRSKNSQFRPMLRILQPGSDSVAHPLISRREWLQLAGLGALAGNTLSAGEADETAKRAPGFGKAKSVILLFANGGQSQIDMWDPKPNAPLDVRGEFSTIRTSVPGVFFGQHLPMMSRVADRCTIIRTMSHEDLDHGTAAYLALTGRYHTLRSANPLPKRTDYPTYGAIVDRMLNDSVFGYNAIHVNGPIEIPVELAAGQNGGFLGRGVEPLIVSDFSDGSNPFQALTPREDLPLLRMQRRHSLKSALDDYLGHLSTAQTVADQREMYGKALEVLSKQKAREVFDLGLEKQNVRDRYGDNVVGQSCLMARRLVEAGIPWTTVMLTRSNRGQDAKPDDTDAYGWDTHNDIFMALREHLIPRFDRAVSALIEDLDQRGLLDETLVVCMGEFGRAPIVALEPRFAGNAPGRKHWARVYSILVAGAGVQRGKVVGSSDRMGGEPITKAYGPWDVAATMFSSLGISPNRHYHDAFNRPFPVTIGKPISEIY